MEINLTEYMTHGVLLMDGGIGQELRNRSQAGDDKLWGVQVLLEEPELMRQLHGDYIRAGAKVITTNTYATVRKRLEGAGVGERFEEVLKQGGLIAQQSREALGADVLIAGALPPLSGSYRPDRVGSFEEIEPIYREHVELLAPYVDLFVCETMSTAQEGRAAAHAAASSGKPVWMAWTLKDEASKLLRSGETLAEAWAALAGIPIQALLVNCCSPESVTCAMPELAGLGVPFVGGYANGFASIPEKWDYHQGVSKLGKREMTPEIYGQHVQSWMKSGANIVGGCCQIAPAHIQHLHEMLVAS